MSEFPNTGALFKNDRKESDRHPDYNGSIDINGVEHWLSAWVKTSTRTGKKFFSLSIGDVKEPRTASPDATPPPADEPDDDIPF